MQHIVWLPDSQCVEDSSILQSNTSVSPDDPDDTLHVSEVETQTEVHLDGNEECSSVSNSALYKLLLNVNLSVKQVRNTLDDHISNCTQTFAQLRDEIQSMKNQFSLRTDKTENIISDLSENTVKVHSNIDHLSSLLQRKLQSVFDLLKTINEKHRKNQNTVAPSTETVEPLSETEEVVDEETSLKVIDVEWGDDSYVSQTSESSTANEWIVSRQSRTREERISQRALIDSILKGIDKRGINRNVDVRCLRGGAIKDVLKTICQTDMSVYYIKRQCFMSVEMM